MFNKYSGVIAFILSGIIIWVITSISADVKDLRTDVKKICSEVVYKCDYLENTKILTNILQKLDDRIRELEIKNCKKIK